VKEAEITRKIGGFANERYIEGFGEEELSATRRAGIEGNNVSGLIKTQNHVSASSLLYCYAR
jgi:hypothetical protein